MKAGLQYKHMQAMLGLAELRVLILHDTYLAECNLSELGVLTNLHTLHIDNSGTRYPVLQLGRLTGALNSLRKARGLPPIRTGSVSS
jgi:hypothetical protein